MPKDEIYIRYIVPNTPSLVWYSGWMPSSGVMLPGAWLHSHRARYQGFLLLASSLHQMNFSCPSFGIRNVSGEHAAVDDLRKTYDAFRSRGRVVCQDWATEPRGIQIWDVDAGVQSGRYFDRYGPPLDCDARWSFRRGDSWTVAGFTSARWDANRVNYPNHFAFFFYADLEGDSMHSTDYTLDAELEYASRESTAFNICPGLRSGGE